MPQGARHEAKKIHSHIEGLSVSERPVNIFITRT